MVFYKFLENLEYLAGEMGTLNLCQRKRWFVYNRFPRKWNA